MTRRTRIGVLAVQGAFAEHLNVLRQIGVEGAEVRLPDDLEGVAGLILPGGESTAQPVQIAPNSVVQAGTFGVMKFTLKDGGYDWQFLPIPGQTFTDAGSASCHDRPAKEHDQRGRIRTDE